MSPECHQLQQLLADYLATVNQAVTLLNAKSAQQPGFQTERSGYLDAHRRVHYVFHGIGCRVSCATWHVDFDLGPQGRCDGLDPWFVFDFLSENAAVSISYPLLTSHEQLERLLPELVAAGVVSHGEKLLGAATYYRVADLANLRPLRWKPRRPPTKRPNHE